MDRASISSLIKKIHKGTPGTGMKDDVKAVIKRAGGGRIPKKKMSQGDQGHLVDTSEGIMYVDNPDTLLYNALKRNDKENVRLEDLINQQFWWGKTPKNPGTGGLFHVTDQDLENQKDRIKQSNVDIRLYREYMKKLKDYNYPSKYAKGGYTGGGDQPAALSEGEYVIPADVVSMLGDGNSDAGAKILEQFCTQIRKEKGKHLAKGKQAPPLTK